ncbi:MAG: hypothetical protein AMJ95_10535 [Omnitrophica WOR_2 bacterium SM23_72]|nr:MAG: hypothetical protein AMJ95_10535 [Omnitrophica WOR_2 bacterium SM23_72]
MGENLNMRIGRFLARHRKNGLVFRLMNWLFLLHKLHENLDYDFFSNGEHFVLQTVQKNSRIETVFDVGANVGEWSKIAAETFSQARIYSFEIIPQTYERLLDNCVGHNNIKPFKTGLSDKDGECEAFFSPDKSDFATCVRNLSETFHNFQPGRITVKTTTGDRFCSQNKIETIDYLKIDVEGVESQVLKGFERMLRGADKDYSI